MVGRWWDVVHWELCKRYGLSCTKKWYDHIQDSGWENEKSKILWDFRIQTDQLINHNRFDIVFYDKEKNECKIIDVSSSFDGRVTDKRRGEKGKIRGFQKRDGKVKGCQERVVIIPILIGSLGTLGKNFKRYVKGPEVRQFSICCPEEGDLKSKRCEERTMVIVK